MVTIEDFRKLIKLEEAGCHIFLDGEEVHGLMVDEEMDAEDYEDSRPEIVCSFTFVLDRYTTVQCLTEFMEGDWTVARYEDVDWRSQLS